MNSIEVEHLTKDYGGGRGVFDLSLSVREGETVGYVGTNGSGKTTTIRHLMGFLRADSGTVRIAGKDAYLHASALKKLVGYVPGEIAFPDLKTGTEFLQSQAELLGLHDLRYAEELIERLQLDPSADPRRMSKGMKQKTAIVAALMANPPILLLDEPTTGLDPLMREAFLSILRDEQKKGKTIFMSTHQFEELETTADRAALLMNGRITGFADLEAIRNPAFSEYKIEFKEAADYQSFLALNFTVVRRQDCYAQATVRVKKEELPALFDALAARQVRFIAENKYNLERYFKEHLLKKENSYAE